MPYLPTAFETPSVVFLMRGPRAREAAAEDRAGEPQARHLAHLAATFERGKLAVAGPVGRDEDDEMSGICVYRCGSDEATALASTDPAVQAGFSAVEARVGRFPAGHVAFPRQGDP